MRSALFCSILCALACGKNPSGTLDSGTSDPGDVGSNDRGGDGGPLDGGANDGSNDGGTVDADPNDAAGGDGEPRDGEPMDGDALDGEPLDGEPLDGEPLDAEPEDAAAIDAGPIDGGFLPAFTQRTIDTSFLHGQSVAPIDIEGDGDLDVVGTISLDDTVRLYLNGGDGGAWNAIDVAPVGSIVGIHASAADFDADGDLDIAAIGLFDRSIGFASPGEVTWYRNPGSPAGSWTEVPITGLTFWGPRTMAAGDLTGDGAPELVVGAREMMDQNGGPQGNGVYWFRNTGGAFAGAAAIDAGLRGVETVLLHDVDADGVLDIIASGALTGEIAWYENQRPPGVVQANPTFVRHTLFAIAEPSGLALAQRDGDPALELFATGDNGGGGLIALLDPPADPRNAWSSNPVVSNFGAGRGVRLAAGDLNLDGEVDVSISAFDANAVRAYVANGAAWIPRTVQEPFMGPTSIAIGDVDGDGIADLITSTYGFDSSFDRFDWWRTQP